MSEMQKRVKATGLTVWRGKSPEKMTDDECREFLSFMGNRLGIYYF